jgi:hypothetical protein
MRGLTDSERIAMYELSMMIGNWSREMIPIHEALEARGLLRTWECSEPECCPKTGNCHRQITPLGAYVYELDSIAKGYAPP